MTHGTNVPTAGKEAVRPSRRMNDGIHYSRRLPPDILMVGIIAQL